jgi:hypothetical protein
MLHTFQFPNINNNNTAAMQTSDTEATQALKHSNFV